MRKSNFLSCGFCTDYAEKKITLCHITNYFTSLMVVVNGSLKKIRVVFCHYLKSYSILQNPVFQCWNMDIIQLDQREKKKNEVQKEGISKCYRFKVWNVDVFQRWKMRAVWCSLSAGLCLHRPWFEMMAYPVPRQGEEGWHNWWGNERIS